MAQLTLPTATNLSATLSRWKSQLDPVLANPLLDGQQLNDISMVANTPLIINHSLGQYPQGWFVVDNVVNCTVWRTQPFNQKTITLESSASTTISIWIF